MMLLLTRVLSKALNSVFYTLLCNYLYNLHSNMLNRPRTRRTRANSSFLKDVSPLLSFGIVSGSHWNSQHTVLMSLLQLLFLWLINFVSLFNLLNLKNMACFGEFELERIVFVGQIVENWSLLPVSCSFFNPYARLKKHTDFTLVLLSMTWILNFSLQ